MVFQKRDRENAKDSRRNGGDADSTAKALPQKMSQWPVEGMFGEFGGRHVPESLNGILDQLEETFSISQNDDNFQRELRLMLSDYAGRQTALYHAKRLTRAAGGARIYLKREDLSLHGLSDLSSVVGQIMLAKQLKKQRLITAAITPDQILAIASAVTAYGFEVKIFVGQHDFDAAQAAVQAVQQMGVRVQSVPGGQGGIGEAVDAALNEWASSSERSHMIMTSAIGPHPIPWIVREFQRVVGDEIKGQILRKERRLPDQVLALYRTGSLSLGAFAPFIDDEHVKLVAVEMMEKRTSQNPLLHGESKVICGMKSICATGGDSAVNMNPPSAPVSITSVASPEMAFYHSKNCMEYAQVTSEQSKEGYQKLLRSEGIYASEESSYVIYALLRRAKELGSDGLIVAVMNGQGSPKSHDRDEQQKTEQPPQTDQPAHTHQHPQR